MKNYTIIKLIKKLEMHDNELKNFFESNIKKCLLFFSDL